MNGSAYQMMRSEIHQLQREVAGRDEHIQKLIATLQQRDSAIVNLNMSIAALLYLSRPEAPATPRPRGLKRLSRKKAARQERQAHGSITIPKALIDEIQRSQGLIFEASQTRNPDTGDVTMSARRRSPAEIAELEQKVQAEQAAALEQARKQQEEQQAASRVVAPDGRPAREAARSKIVVVQ